ncbi:MULTISPECIES: hypothetical protein [unclassified Empedobacter]|uniref:hypothetical protein n=1 Tax=unclassified Empedobacter TaxID=2643773 RepID=UPI0025BC4688|nr:MULTISPECIES: hypothetical protein [unclassified Empedobacter]
MNYPGEFKERAQIEMSKRLGFNSRTECVNSLGVKEFARKRDEFYKTFFKEENELIKVEVSNQQKVMKNKDLPEKLELIFEYIKQNPETRIYKVEEKFLFCKFYLNIVVKLGYVANIGSKHKPIFIVKQQGKSCAEIIAEVRNYSKLKQRRVRENEARRILNGE